MKYKIIVLLFICLFVIGCNDKIKVFDINKYQASTLKEALEMENIETTFDLSKYDESKAKLTIYLFYGSGCPHCYDFLSFFANDLLDEYGNDIRLVGYEIWNYPDNKRLLKKVRDFLGDGRDGVPYIIIGSEVIYGYIPSMADNVRSAIDNALENNDFDVLKELDKSLNS